MKKWIYLVIIIFLLVISWSITGYMLYSHGIHITNTYHQYQYQNQQQAQLLFGLYASRGQIERILYTVEYIKSKGIKGETDFEIISNFLNTLPPEQSLFAIISKSEKIVSVPNIKNDN